MHSGSRAGLHTDSALGGTPGARPARAAVHPLILPAPACTRTSPWTRDALHTDRDTLAERSKAVAQGAIPKGRGFESHSCHFARGAWSAQGVATHLRNMPQCRPRRPSPARFNGFNEDLTRGTQNSFNERI